MADLDAEPLAHSPQSTDHGDIRDHMRKGLAFRHVAVEGEEDRANRIGRARIRYDHLVDRLGFRLQLLPDAEDIQHAACGGDDRGGADVLLPDVFRCGFDDLHTKMRRCLLDGDGNA